MLACGIWEEIVRVRRPRTGSEHNQRRSRELRQLMCAVNRGDPRTGPHEGISTIAKQVSCALRREQFDMMKECPFTGCIEPVHQFDPLILRRNLCGSPLL